MGVDLDVDAVGAAQQREVAAICGTSPVCSTPKAKWRVKIPLSEAMSLAQRLA